MSSVFFTEEENEYREKVRDFVEREILPEVDRIERENIYARDLYYKLGKEGFMKPLYPKEYGGNDLGLSYEIIVDEELAAVSAGFATIPLVSHLCAVTILRHGTEEQKKKYVEPIARGEKIAGIAITEPNVGCDAAGMETRAILDGDEYVINGEKRFTTNGSQADYLIVWAITNPDVHPHKGMSAFIVEKDFPGFEVVKDFELMGSNGIRNSQERFINMRVPKENLLGKEGEGFKIVVDELAIERTMCAAMSLGVARASFGLAVKYSNERKQFGVPIRNFEAISFTIADMATRIEGSRLLTLKAARMIDRGMPAVKEASMAKVFASETAFEVAHKALQILGGIGYTKEKPAERYFRDARLMLIVAGTSEMMRFLIQREVYREQESDVIPV
ncbi:MAG: acyl-CoA dehydrogenase family protein [Candidatus Syntropharchaeia archaeon]